MGVKTKLFKISNVNSPITSAFCLYLGCQNTKMKSRMSGLSYLTIPYLSIYLSMNEIDTYFKYIFHIYKNVLNIYLIKWNADIYSPRYLLFSSAILIETHNLPPFQSLPFTHIKLEIFFIF